MEQGYITQLCRATKLRRDHSTCATFPVIQSDENQVAHHVFRRRDNCGWIYILAFESIFTSLFLGVSRLVQNALHVKISWSLCFFFWNIYWYCIYIPLLRSIFFYQILCANTIYCVPQHRWLSLIFALVYCYNCLLKPPLTRCNNLRKISVIFDSGIRWSFCSIVRSKRACCNMSPTSYTTAANTLTASSSPTGIIHDTLISSTGTHPFCSAHSSGLIKALLFSRESRLLRPQYFLKSHLIPRVFAITWRNYNIIILKVRYIYFFSLKLP